MSAEGGEGLTAADGLPVTMEGGGNC